MPNAYVVHVPLTRHQAEMILEWLRSLEAEMTDNRINDPCLRSTISGARTRVQDALNAQ